MHLISIHIGNIPKLDDRDTVFKNLKVLLGPIINLDLPRNKTCEKCLNSKQCCNDGFAVVTILKEKWNELVDQLPERYERRNGRMQEYSLYYGQSQNDRFDISVRNPLLDKNSAKKNPVFYEQSTSKKAKSNLLIDPFKPEHYENHRKFWKSCFL